MSSIQMKGLVYKRQMRPIREKLRPFLEAHDWEWVSRGRHAHASMAGPVGKFRGVLDIEMIPVAWDEMPELLGPGWPVQLWCVGCHERDGKRLNSPVELHWTCSFGELEQVVQPFLDRAWTMLTSLKEEDFLEKWPGPSVNPQPAQHLSPPRARG